MRETLSANCNWHRFSIETSPGGSMTKFILAIALSQPASAANLYYGNKEATFHKDEPISTIIVHGEKRPTVSVHTQNISCHIETRNIDEAFKIQDSLTNDP